MSDEIVTEFLVESYESLDQLDRDLLALEETPHDRSHISSIFRTVHTIKGTSGFLAFPVLEELTHAGESLLVPLRDGELTLTRDIANSLLAMVDAIRLILQEIEQTGEEGVETWDLLIEQLETLRNGEPLPAELPPPAGENESPPLCESTAYEPERSEARACEPATSEHSDSRQLITGSAASGPERAERSDDRVRTTADADGNPGCGHSLQSPESEGGPTATGEDQNRTSPCGSVTENTVRIDVQLLDKLMNLVGELVLARNQILQYVESVEDAGLTAASQKVNLITTELQESVMKTRMQPIRRAWNKMPRVVRDLAHSCGKQVQLNMEGADTELDKTILEAIRDPLTHIVRNSIDHGIEPPDVRLAAGKPAEGTLDLRAFHEGGQINIEIADDGKGLDLEAIRTRALEHRLVTEEDVAAMSDRETMSLILLPGFSTAPMVTSVSGRGVGMDVVKTNVEKIGGTLDILSVPGQGTTLRIRIPLTLAIVPALVVTCGGDHYCIPQVSLLELVRLEGERLRNEIEVLHSVPVYRLRGQLLPLVYLDEKLGLRPPRTHQERHSEAAASIVVLQAEDTQFGLIVDEINDTQEIVVKPLGQHLNNVHTYAGSTIMGDGTVSLILNVVGIAQQAGMLTEQGGCQLSESDRSRSVTATRSSSFLLVEPAPQTRAAIPLGKVARLEEIAIEDIEYDGRQQVVQYRGAIMPLVSLLDHGPSDPDLETVSLVVHNDNGRNVGIVVGRIIDIVEHEPDDDESDTEGTRIIAGRITQIIDPASAAGAVLSPRHTCVPAVC